MSYTYYILPTLHATFVRKISILPFIVIKGDVNLVLILFFLFFCQRKLLYRTYSYNSCCIYRYIHVQHVLKKYTLNQHLQYLQDKSTSNFFMWRKSCCRVCCRSCCRSCFHVMESAMWGNWFGGLSCGDLPGGHPIFHVRKELSSEHVVLLVHAGWASYHMMAQKLCTSSSAAQLVNQRGKLVWFCPRDGARPDSAKFFFKKKKINKPAFLAKHF